MARARDHRPLIVLRWVLFGLLVVVAAALVYLYLQRETEPQPPRPAAGPSPVADARDRDVVLAGEGFEYAVSEDGKELFFIRAERMLSDRQNRFGLEGVRISFESESGDQFEVASERATYDLETRNAHLEGSVVLAGPDGVELRGDAFDIRRRGQVLENQTPGAEFRLEGGYRGTARTVRIHLRRRLLRMAGDVTLTSPPGSEPPLSLRAGRMAFHRDEAVLRAESNVRFRRGEDRLQSRRLSVAFTADVRGVRMIQGSWDVEGRFARQATIDREEAISFRAAKFAVLYDETGDAAQSAELQGGGGLPVVLHLDDGAGQRRTVRSARLDLVFAGGSVSGLESFVPVVLDEGLARDDALPRRRLCGDSLSLRIADGRLTALDLGGAVGYQEPALAALGSRLTSDDGEAMRLAGSPARLLRAGGEIEAPEIVYSRRSSSVRASGGVRASGQEQAGVELAAGGGGAATVRVIADEATWTDEPPQTVFEGSVRAWQGDSFLLADRLAAAAGGDRLEAEGSVKTLWKPQPAGAEGRPPIEVNAGKLVYLRQESKLSYSGSVRVHQSGRTMRCRELDIAVNDERRIDNLLCQGDAVIDDPVAGRNVRGAEVLYTPADGIMLISGEPVILKDRDGTEIRGRRLRYDLESGQVQVLSEPRARPRQPENAPARTDG